MDEHTKVLIKKLHEPFDTDLAEEFEVPHPYKDSSGKMHHETVTITRFPDWDVRAAIE